MGADRAVACRRRRFIRWAVTRRGFPTVDAMDAIMLVLRTGMQWNALNATGVCSSSSAHRRFQEWEQAGVFHEIWRQGLLDYDEAGRDRLVVAGGRRRDEQGAARRRRRRARIPLTGPRGGEAFGPHRGAGVPVGLDHDGANRNDHKLLKGTLDSIPIERPEPTAEHPQGLCSGQGLRQPRRPRAARRLRAHAAHPRSRRGDRPQGTATRTGERAAGSSRPATPGSTATAAILIRWSKKDENHLALLQLASGLIAFKSAHATRTATALPG